VKAKIMVALVMVAALATAGCSGSNQPGSGSSGNNSCVSTPAGNTTVYSHCPTGVPIQTGADWTVEVNGVQTTASSDPTLTVWIIGISMTNHSGGTPVFDPRVTWPLMCPSGNNLMDSADPSFPDQFLDGQTLNTNLHFSIASTNHRCTLQFHFNANISEIASWDLSI
jgi:hypothetical protein